MEIETDLEAEVREIIEKLHIQKKVLSDILCEREGQELKWVEQNHDPYTYLAILLEEVGEYARACLQTQFGGKHGGLDKMRTEAVQVAAVATAIIECLDREKWTWPPQKQLETVSFLGDKSKEVPHA